MIRIRFEGFRQLPVIAHRGIWPERVTVLSSIKSTPRNNHMVCEARAQVKGPYRWRTASKALKADFNNAKLRGRIQVETIKPVGSTRRLMPTFS